MAPPLVLAVLGGGVCVAFAVYLALGSVQIPLGRVLEVIFTYDTKGEYGPLIWGIRVPRALYAMIIGAGLGAVGSAFQALFRNPLADPYIVGVSSGASVGGALAMVLAFGREWTGLFQGLGVTAACTAGGLISLGMVILLARRRSVLDVQTLLLAGVVLGALMSALLSLVLLWGGEDTNVVLRWLLGSLTNAVNNRIALLALVTATGLAILISQAKLLNVYAVGEDTAQRLGVNTRRLKPLVLVTGTFMVAVTVGCVGIIGFLGLVSPHIARRMVGVDWRYSLVASSLVGSILLLGSDVLAQRIIGGGEVPVGIVTAVLGAPFLLVLMRKRAVA